MLSGLIAELPQWLVLTASSIVGLVVGSFLNVVIHRIPLGLSIVRPGSACPECGASIAAFDNIPVLSFLMLKGRCRKCRKRVSLTYPFVEILTSLLFAGIVWLHGPTWRSLGEWWFVSILIALIVIDARHHLLPDRITFPSLPIAIAIAITRIPILAELDPMLEVGQTGFSRWRVALLGATIIVGSSFAFWLLDQLDSLLFGKYYDYQDEAEDADELDEAELDRQYARTNRLTRGLGMVFAMVWVIAVVFDGPRDPGLYAMAFGRLASAALAAVIAASFLWFIRAGYFYWRGMEGMGLGDVKLTAIIGAFLGWPPAIMVLLIASFFGIFLGVVIARRSGRGMNTPLPLGACLGSAAILVAILLDVGLYSWI